MLNEIDNVQEIRDEKSTTDAVMIADKILHQRCLHRWAGEDEVNSNRCTSTMNLTSAKIFHLRQLISAPENFSEIWIFF